ncbi:Uncharacterised protein [Klebsiella grimontii]|uniref:Uncharacterized protein n=1 Tax=Klebsiella grimontii TaxID=2058152 RepID=A0A7H4P3B4_9ENTR|nr:Uncharacterised protein [Klebsiella grimontii]
MKPKSAITLVALAIALAAAGGYWLGFAKRADAFRGRGSDRNGPQSVVLVRSDGPRHPLR